MSYGRFYDWSIPYLTNHHLLSIFRYDTVMAPVDKTIPVEYGYHTVAVRMWRYMCHCGNVWANSAQRIHNEHEMNKAIAAVRALWQ
jgi:hypothetical protein